MDNKGPNSRPAPETTPPPASSNQMPLSSANNAQPPVAPQSPVTLSANSLNLANPPKESKKAILYVAIVIVIIAAVVGVFAAIQNIDKNHSSTLKTTAPTNTKNGSVVNPDQNPLNNNGPINAQVKYCSNPVNAELVC